MNSKTDLQRSTDLLNIPSSDFVKQAYAMAAEINTSSPDVSAMLRASAARIDVFNALVGTVASAKVERYTPDYKMHLNHELAFMRPNPNGSWIGLADYLTLMNEKNDLQKQVRALAAANEDEKLLIAKLLEDARRIQVIEPNAGTEARVKDAIMCLAADEMQP